MRTLALLMLLTVGAAGQDSSMAHIVSGYIVADGEWRTVQWGWANEFISAWDAYAKECWADSVAERGFWFSKNGSDSAVSESYTGPKWWRPWDSMGEFLEGAYRTKAVIRYVHPNAVPPNPFIEWLRRKQ